MTLTEPIRDKSHVQALLSYYLNRGEIRNHLLICLCLHTALRISDVLRLTTNDVYDFQNRSIRKTITIAEQKTGKTKIIALHKNIVKVLTICFPTAMPNTPLIRNRRTGKAISRVQAYRIIKAAAKDAKLPQKVSCHSLRKTFGYHAWKSGVSPAVIMEIFNHSSFHVTRRYLGILQDDKNDAYLNLNLVG